MNKRLRRHLSLTLALFFFCETTRFAQIRMYGPTTAVTDSALPIVTGVSPTAPSNPPPSPAPAQRTISRASLGNQGEEGNDESNAASLSFDGRFVAFESEADNLVGGDTNDEQDNFVRNPTSEVELQSWRKKMPYSVSL